MHDDHASKRETLLLRWVPEALYSVNLLLWIITDTEAGRGLSGATGVVPR